MINKKCQKVNKPSSSASNSFEKLSPQKVNIDAYTDALDFAFNEDDLLNIAITGAHGAGKSSVIKTYLQDYDNKAIIISLAQFNEPIDNDVNDIIDEHNVNNNTSTNTIDLENKEINNVINQHIKNNISCGVEDKTNSNSLETKMINHLIHQIDFKKTPKTAFSKKQKTKWYREAINIIGISSIIIWILYYLTHDKNVFNPLDLLQNAQIYSINISLLSTIVCTFIVFCSYQFIHLNSKKYTIKKFSIKGTAIDLYDNDDTSAFDKHLDEILYILKNSGLNTIVFEDIDRFDSVEIFTKLREINFLLNNDENSKIEISNGGNTDKENNKSEAVDKNKTKLKRNLVKFVYVMKDDLFFQNDKTKFFDFIIPIIPAVDCSNSYHKLNEMINVECEVDRFTIEDQNFLKRISYYIDDIRVLKNINNEYKTYHKKLSELNKPIENNKLFAIIVYKNLFPKDFTRSQYNQGYLSALLEKKSKDNFIKSKLIRIEEELKEVQKTIDQVITDDVNRRKKGDETSRELDDLHDVIIQEYYSFARQGLKEEVGKDFMVPYERRNMLLSQKNEWSKWQDISQMLSKDTNFSEYSEFVIENDKFSNWIYNLEIKNSKQNHAIEYLIAGAHIDEHYKSYLTPSRIDTDDKEFILSLSKDPLDFNYIINSNSLISILEAHDFNSNSIFNFNLLDGLLEKNHNYKTNFIDAIFTYNQKNFVSKYIERGTNIESFVKVFNEVGHQGVENFFDIQEQNEITKMYVLTSLKVTPIRTLRQGHLKNFFNEVLSDNYWYLLDDKVNEKMLNTIREMDIKFKNTNVKFKEPLEVYDANQTKKKKELLKFIYTNNLYEFKNELLKKLIVEFYPKNATSEEDLYAIISSDKTQPLYKYATTNQRKYLKFMIKQRNAWKDHNRDTINSTIDKVTDTTIKKYVNEFAINPTDYNSFWDRDVYEVLLKLYKTK